jgi:hypothetical protein
MIPTKRTVYRSQWPCGLRSLTCSDCGFESRMEHGYLSLVSVVCCQVAVSALGWSLVQRSHTECGVSEFDREASLTWKPWPNRGCCSVRRLEVMQLWLTWENMKCQRHWVLLFQRPEFVYENNCCKSMIKCKTTNCWSWRIFLRVSAR